MDLAELKFKVETGELLKAVQALKDMREGVNNLTKPLEELGTAGKTAAAGVSAIAKVKPAKPVEEIADAATKATDGLTGVERTLKKLETQTKVMRGSTVELADAQIRLDGVFTKSQANMLANIKMQGASADQMRQAVSLLNEMQAMSGANPFDKSTQGLAALKKEVQEMQMVSDLMNKGLALSRNEASLLSRDIARLTSMMEKEGYSAAELDAKIEELTSDTVKYAREKAQLISIGKQAEEQQKREAAAALELANAKKLALQAEEKNLGLIRANAWQEFGSGLGVRSEELTDLANFYRQQEILAKESSDAEKFIVFNKWKWKRDFEEQQQQQEYSELKAHYAALEALDRQRTTAVRIAEKEQAEARRQIDLMKSGYSASEAKQVMRFQDQGVDEANINSLITAQRNLAKETKEVQEAQRAQAREANKVQQALEYLIRTEQALDATIENTNENIDRRHITQLQKMQRMYNIAGQAALDAGVDMDVLRKKMDAVAGKEQSAKLRNLSRAMSVQMGDVAISLASGMNPFLVMIQQGDQIRGVIEQTDASAAELRKTMSTAAAQIGKSIVDTGKVIGNFVTGTLVSMGTGLSNITIKTLGLQKTLRDLEVALTINEAAGSKWAGTFLKLGRTIPAILGTAAAAGATAVLSLAVAFVKVSNEEDRFLVSTTLTNGALGQTTDQLYTTAKALGQVTGNTSKVIEVISEMGKAGNLTSKQIEQVSKVAIELEKWTGVALKETVKLFSELQKEPSKALAEVSSSLGGINSAVMQQVALYELRGEKSKASALAASEAEKAHMSAIESVQKNYNALGRAFKWAGQQFSDFWSGVKNLVRDETLEEALMQQIETIELQMSLGSRTQSRENKLKDQLRTLKSELQSVRRSNQAIEDRKNSTRIANQWTNDARSEWDQNLNALDEYTLKMQKLAKLRENMLTNMDIQALGGEQSLAVRNLDNKIKKLAEERAKATSSGDDLAQAEKYYQRIMEQGADLVDKYTGKVDLLSKSQIALKQVQNDEQYKSLSEVRKQAIIDIFNEADAEERLLAVRDAAANALKKHQEEWEKTLANQKEMTSKNEALNVALDDQTAALMNQTYLLGQSDSAQKSYNLTLAAGIRLRNELLDIERESEKYASPYDKQKAIDDAQNRYRQSLFNINSEVSLDAANKLLTEIQNIRQGLADALYTGLVDGAEAAKTSIRKLLADEIRKKMTMQINLMLNAMMNSIMGSSGSNWQQAVASGQSGNNIMNNLGAAYSAYQSGGLSGVGSYFGGANTVNVTGATGTAKASAGTGMSGYATTAAAVYMAAKKSFNDVEQGWNRQAAQNTSGVFRPGGAALAEHSRILERSGINKEWADFLSTTPAYTKIFGRAAPRVEAAGIEGTYSGGNFSGNSFQQMYAKGGLLRKSKTWTETQALNEADRQSFQSSIQLVESGIKDMAATLGLSSDRLKDFTYSLKVDLAGLSEEDATKKLQEEFAKISDAMANQILVVADWKREGESSTETLTRLADTLGSVNALFKDIGWNLFDVSLAGFSAADSFVNLLGGLDEAKTALSSYYQNFYSEEEQLANVMQNLKGVFAELGVEMPTTKEGFRDLVDSAKALGNDTLVAELLKLNADYNSIMQAQVEILEQRTSLENTLLEMLGATDELRKRQLEGMSEGNKALQEQIWKLEDARAAQEKYNAAGDELNSTVDGLLKTLNDFLNGTVETQQQFDALLSKAMSGDTDAISKLPTAAQSVIDATREASSTAFEANLAQAQVMQQVRDVANALGDPESSLQQKILDAILAVQTNTGNTVNAFNAFASMVSTDLVTTVSVVAVSNLPDDLKAIANTANGILIRTVDFVLGSTLEPVWQEQLLSDSKNLTRLIQMIANDTALSEPQKELLLNSSTLASRYIGLQAQFASNLTEAEKSLLVQASTEANRIINQSVVTGAMSQTDYLILTQQNASVQKIVQGLIQTDLSQTQLDVLNQQNQTVQKVVQALGDSSGLSQTDLNVLNQQNQTIQKIVQGVIQTGDVSAFDQQLLLQQTETVQKVVNTLINSGNLTAQDQAFLLQQNQTVQKIVNGLVDVSNLSPDQLALVNAIGTDTATLQLSAEVAFGPNSTIVPLLETIADNTYVSAIVDRGDNPDVPTPRTPPGTHASYAKGGAFTNGIVTKPTMFHNSQMGEAGSEAIMPLTRTSDGSLGVIATGSDNSELIAEIRMLNAKVDQLEAAAKATAISNSKIQKVLERVTPDGSSLRVSTED
jgi:phage-related minor tail protein